MNYFDKYRIGEIPLFRWPIKYMKIGGSKPEKMNNYGLRVMIENVITEFYSGKETLDKHFELRIVLETELRKVEHKIKDRYANKDNG